MTAAVMTRVAKQVSLGYVSSIQKGVYAGETLYGHCMAAPRTADGYLVAAGTGTTGPVAGVAEADAANTAAGASSGDVSSNLLQGLFYFENYATHPVLASHFGLPCYAKDDQTVSCDSGDGPAAGIVMGVDSALGVLVYISAPINKALELTAAAVTATLASVLTGEGASTVGVEDTALHFATANVEAVLADLGGRIHLAVADATALAAIPAGSRVNGMVCVDLALDTIWTFDSGSVAGASNWVVVPAAGTGRWVRNHVSLVDLSSTTAAYGSALIGSNDTGGYTTQTTVETQLQEIYSHLLSAKRHVLFSLYDAREVDGNGDVGNVAAGCGCLASDTTPILRGDAAESQEIYWVAGNTDIVAFQTALPQDFDDTADATLDLWVRTTKTGAGEVDPATFTVETSWNGGALVSDTADDTATISATAHKITATIANADIPAGAAFVTIILTGAAHATDHESLLGVRLNYKAKITA